MTDDLNETMLRVIDALRPLPHVDDAAKARVLVAVAAERQREREAPLRRMGPLGRRWAVLGIGAAAAAVLALLLFGMPNGPERRPQGVVSGAGVVASIASPATRLAAANADKSTAVQLVQLVLRAPAASRVRVVGDFNSWDGDHTSMARDPESGLWTATLSLRPGRHVYAYIVDDSIWMRDPRAPAAMDADFGRPGSVLLVGRP